MENLRPEGPSHLWDQRICRICFKQFENVAERLCHEKRGHVPRAVQNGAHNYLFQCSSCKTVHENMIGKHGCEMKHFLDSIQAGARVCKVF